MIESILVNHLKMGRVHIQLNSPESQSKFTRKAPVSAIYHSLVFIRHSIMYSGSYPLPLRCAYCTPSTKSSSPPKRYSFHSHRWGHWTTWQCERDESEKRVVNDIEKRTATERIIDRNSIRLLVWGLARRSTIVGNGCFRWLVLTFPRCHSG